MNSPKYNNYEIRPHKFTERRMLLASLQRIISVIGGEYQYIGLGGLAFTDFKLFHKELHIQTLYSIEGGGFTEERLKYNSPYEFINIIRKETTSALQEIDLNTKTIVWLDYDGEIDNYFFEDITYLFKRLPSGSIYILTCNRQLKDTNTGEEYEVESFREKFELLVPFNIENSSFTSENNYRTIRTMVSNHINTTLRERNDMNDENLSFNQLIRIKS